MHRRWCRQRAKVTRKCKCQRKLLIVSAVAFALPPRAARPRTKSQRRKKNIKPSVQCEEKKQAGQEPHIVARGYLATSFGHPSSQAAKQQARACRSGFLNFRRGHCHRLTGSGCGAGAGRRTNERFTRLLKISLSLSLRRKF